jgi:hypothetical protein
MDQYNPKTDTQAPYSSTSYYINVPNWSPTVAAALGCEEGAVARGDALAVLSFGCCMNSGGDPPDYYGTRLHDSSDMVTTGDIATYVEHFLTSYANREELCPGVAQPKATHLTLVIGTNTSCPGFCDSAHAEKWAEMVDEVSTWVSGQGLANIIDVAGGSDIEAADNWEFPAPTRVWVQAYCQSTTLPLYDFGDAGGCPEYPGEGFPGAGCNNTWTQEDLYMVSWGAEGCTRAVPLIYLNDGAMARQWAAISKYGYNEHGNRYIVELLRNRCML